MSTAKHTPTPWIAMGFPHTNGWDIARQDDDGHTNHIAHLDPYVGNQYDAAFIALACNSHYELLEACKALWQMIEEGKLVRDVAHDGDPDWSRSMLDFTMTLNKVQAALAHAEPHAHLEAKE